MTKSTITLYMKFDADASKFQFIFSDNPGDTSLSTDINSLTAVSAPSLVLVLERP